MYSLKKSRQNCQIAVNSYAFHKPKPRYMRYYLLAMAVIGITIYSCSDSKETDVKEDFQTLVKDQELTKDQMVLRGQYLTTIADCVGCHSPKVFTAHGMALDSTRLFSGHPADAKLPPIDINATKPGNWMNMAGDITAFVGPWGVSYTANLTPDSATGIGAWTEANFINALRTGKHMGMENGRPIMPPMTWEVVGKMTDEDLKSIYAYLRSLPPISNKVPAPIPPNEIK